MPPVRIWLNRNYATSVHLVGQLRANPEGTPVEVFASHVDASSPVLAVADHVLPEPDADDPDVAERALELCRRNRIDVFLPVAAQLAIARRRADFEAIGTALICPSAAAIEVLADKAETYRALPGDDLVPPHRLARTVRDFDEACRALRSDWTASSPLVVKPARGVGADGVRFLTKAGPSLAELLGPAGLWTSAQQFRTALHAAERAEAESVPDLLVMPYLPGPETSMDILARRGDMLAAVPRTKRGRLRILDGPDELYAMSARLVDTFQLDGLVNVQFRTYHGRPVLLEINSRPSGGMYQTGLAGVNMIWSAVAVALGRPTALELPRLGAEYVTVSGTVQLTEPELDIAAAS